MLLYYEKKKYSLVKICFLVTFFIKKTIFFITSVIFWLKKATKNLKKFYWYEVRSKYDIFLKIIEWKNKEK